MFQTYVEQPVFNLLVSIYALVPGYDLGLAIILFTIVIRLALWPLVRKQLHHARAMRKLQPELKKIKKAAKGDRQKEARLQMELYKEHEVRPFATIGTLIVQIPIFIALYQSVLKLINNPDTLYSFTYSWVKNLPHIQDLANGVAQFDPYFLGLVDLTKYGFQRGGGIYFGALVLAAIAGFTQYKQSKLMLQDQKDARKLSVILKEASSGKQTDQTEIAGAVTRGMVYFLPFITFIFAMNVPSALSLYLITSSGVGYLQQWLVLRQDQEELQEIADEPTEEEAQVKKPKKSKSKAKKSSQSKKRRKKQ
jgi:YidC/Oxa1 family membrane protein insertase